MLITPLIPLYYQHYFKYLLNILSKEIFIMMILSLVCSVMFFLSAIILFMPKFRKYPFFKPFGVYMAYQGIWTLLSYIVNQLFPTNQVMTVFSYLGGLVFCVYFLFIFYMSRKALGKGKPKTQRTRSSAEKSTQRKSQASKSRYKDDESERTRQSKKSHYSKTSSRDRAAKKPEEEEALHYTPLHARKSSAETEEPKEQPAKKKSRFSENSEGSGKYERITSDDDIYEEFNLTEDIPDEIEDEADDVSNMEITDDDLEYFGEEDNYEEDNADDVDLYDSLDDDEYFENDEEDSIDDEDIYGDDLFRDYDDDSDEDDSSVLKGKRYKK